MKVTRIQELPEGYAEYIPAEAYDISVVPDKVDELVYWYGEGDYCGTGEALLRVGEKWFYFSLSHCSCYGPFDGVDADLEKDGETLEELRARMSSELDKSVAALFNAVN